MINGREFWVRGKQRQHQDHDDVDQHVSGRRDGRGCARPGCPRREHQQQRKRCADNAIKVGRMLEIRPCELSGKITPERDHRTGGERADQPVARPVLAARAVL